MLYGPTRHSLAKESSQRTLYRRSAQECVQLDLNHVIAEEFETRKCIWTAAASYDAELDRGDGICVAIFGPRKIYLPGPIICGGTVLSEPQKHHSNVMVAVPLVQLRIRYNQRICKLRNGTIMQPQFLQSAWNLDACCSSTNQFCHAALANPSSRKLSSE